MGSSLKALPHSEEARQVQVFWASLRVTVKVRVSGFEDFTQASALTVKMFRGGMVLFLLAPMPGCSIVKSSKMLV